MVESGPATRRRIARPKTIAAGATTGVRAFVTPTVVYFSTVLIVSAVMTSPALTSSRLATLLAVGGVGALSG